MAVPAVILISAGVLQPQQNIGLPASPAANDSGQFSRIHRLEDQTADHRLGDEANSVENQKRLAELNLLRKKEMTSDTDKLLALAHVLKTEIDIKGRAGLSMEAVRQAEAIAKLAHGVREKMRASLPN